jgi:hypothetical protein
MTSSRVSGERPYTCLVFQPGGVSTLRYTRSSNLVCGRIEVSFLFYSHQPYG